jgi:transposase
MILTHSLKICLAIEPHDMRKSFDGLAALVRNELREEPTSRKLFVFSNRSRNRVKILYWDGSGFWVLAKRLERGRFSWPDSAHHPDKKACMAPEALEMILSGIDLRHGARKTWYEV